MTCYSINSFPGYGGNSNGYSGNAPSPAKKYENSPSEEH